MLGGQQPLFHHILDQLGLFGQHQCGGLFGADLRHSIGVHRVQQVARDIHLVSRSSGNGSSVVVLVIITVVVKARNTYIENENT